VDSLSDEAARLRALGRQRILDTEPEEAFDRIARIAAAAFDAPMAIVSFIDADRQWLKARIGFDGHETPRDSAFCSLTILDVGETVITDAARDPRVAGSPLVCGPPGLGAYLGVPLASPDGFNLGALAVLDTRPRPDFADRPGRLLRDLGDVLERELELREVSQTDDMTGLASRRHFLAELARECRRAARYGRPLSVGYIDIDHFKAINDRHGHAVGDRVLRAISERLRGCLRAQDLIGRLGGEEFGLLLPETGGRAAAALAEQLCAVLREAPIETSEGPVTVTASIGVAAAGHLLPGAGETLLARADRNLYRAKAAGRDCVRGADAVSLDALRRSTSALGVA